MSLFLLRTCNSLANDFIAELRDKDLQKDTMRFRKNMKRIGELLAYEISKKLEFKKKQFIPLSVRPIFLFSGLSRILSQFCGQVSLFMKDL